MIELLILAAAAVILALQFRAFRQHRDRRALRKWPAAPGVFDAADVVVPTSRKEPVRMDVRYSYTVAGTTYAGERLHPSGNAVPTKTAGRYYERTLAPGKPVQVYYDPSDPSSSFLVRPPWDGGVVYPLIQAATVVLAALILIGVLAEGDALDLAALDVERVTYTGSNRYLPADSPVLPAFSVDVPAGWTLDEADAGRDGYFFRAFEDAGEGRSARYVAAFPFTFDSAGSGGRDAALAEHAMALAVWLRDANDYAELEWVERGLADTYGPEAYSLGFQEIREDGTVYGRVVLIPVDASHGLGFFLIADASAGVSSVAAVAGDRGVQDVITLPVQSLRFGGKESALAD